MHQAKYPVTCKIRNRQPQLSCDNTTEIFDVKQHILQSSLTIVYMSPPSCNLIRTGKVHQHCQWIDVNDDSVRTWKSEPFWLSVRASFSSRNELLDTVYEDSAGLVSLTDIAFFSVVLPGPVFTEHLLDCGLIAINFILSLYWRNSFSFRPGLWKKCPDLFLSTQLSYLRPMAYLNPYWKIL